MNNIRKQFVNFDIPRNLQFNSRCPVLVSDSKGRYLFQQVKFDNNIKWYFRSSISCSQHLEIIKRNLPKLIQKHPKGVTLFIWLGTCDLTVKNSDGFISLSSRTNSAVYEVYSVFNQIYFLTKEFTNVNLVFIELPVYSIYWWNKLKNHSNPELFREDDSILHAQIDLLNQYIRDINRLLHVHSPCLSNDLIQSRKQRKRKHSFCSYSFCGYTDGIHPNDELSKLWLLKLCRLFSVYC